MIIILSVHLRGSSAPRLEFPTHSPKSSPALRSQPHPSNYLQTSNQRPQKFNQTRQQGQDRIDVNIPASRNQRSQDGNQRSQNIQQPVEVDIRPGPDKRSQNIQDGPQSRKERSRIKILNRSAAADERAEQVQDRPEGADDLCEIDVGASEKRAELRQDLVEGGEELGDVESLPGSSEEASERLDQLGDVESRGGRGAGAGETRDRDAAEKAGEPGGEIECGSASDEGRVGTWDQGKIARGDWKPEWGD